MDADRARRDRGGHRGAPPGRARCTCTWSATAAPDALHLLPTFVDDGGELRPNPVAARLDARNVPRRRGRAPAAGSTRRGAPRSSSGSPTSGCCPRSCSCSRRAGCDQAVEQCLGGGHAPHRRGRARARCAGSRSAHVDALSDDDLDVLGYDSWLAGLEAGVAAHHAGMVPPMKEAVEEAFAAGLLKVVFATETLSLGINMPARSVVIEKLSKFTGEHHEFLTPGEYTQLAGRAGPPRHRRRRLRRRAVGSVRAVRAGRGPRVAPHVRADVVVPPDLQHGREPRAAVPARAGPPSPQPVVRAVPRRPRRRRRSNASSSAAASSSRGRAPPRDLPTGDIQEYRRLLAELDAARRAAHGHTGAPLRHAPPRRRRDRAEARRPGRGAEAGARARAATGCSRSPRAQRLVRLVARRLPRPGPQGRDASSCPRPFAPRSQAFQRAAVDDAAPAARSTTRSCRRRRRRARSTSSQAAMRRAPAARARPAPTSRCAPRGRPTGSRREIARLERRISTPQREPGPAVRPGARRARGVGLRRRLGADAEPGELLARLNTEGDLVLAEALREGQLDGLDPPTLAALVSCFTYQRRGPDGNEPMPPRRWPSQLVARAVRAIERIWRDLQPGRARRAPAPRPAAPIPASPPRSTPGRRATTSPTCSRTRR